MYCSKCGQFNEEKNQFCKNCGNSLNLESNETNKTSFQSGNILSEEYYRRKKKSRNIVIIALVAFFLIFFLLPFIFTPILLGNIDEQKKENASEYIKALENQIAFEKSNDSSYVIPSIINQPDESLTEDVPDKVLLYLNQDGKVTSGTLNFGKRIYKYENETIHYQGSEE